MASIDLVGAEIADLTELFDRTKNPAAAWRAYSLARQANRPVPESIAAEIDRFAHGIAAVAERAMTAEPTAAPIQFRSEEIGALWRNGTENPIAGFQREYRDYHVFWMILGRVNSGATVTAAIAELAKRKGNEGVRLGEKSLWAIWDRLNKPAMRTKHDG